MLLYLQDLCPEIFSVIDGVQSESFCIPSVEQPGTCNIYIFPLYACTCKVVPY